MIVIAICTHNRAERLPALIKALREQSCEQPFEILFIDNGSVDHTAEIIRQSAKEPGASIRYVLEKKPGIAHARNRAIDECSQAEWMLVMDDDEIPKQGWIQAAVSCFRETGAECVGGSVHVSFEPHKRPGWLSDDLLGFLAETDYGESAFWIEDSTTPIWTANIAYQTSLFKGGLRFDARYNRKGQAVGGGEDVMMFNELLKRGIKMRYCPEMTVIHHIDSFKLKRIYFLKLHFISGFKTAAYELGNYPRSLLGAPLFLWAQFGKQFTLTFSMLFRSQTNHLRQAMNACHALGMIIGCMVRYFKHRKANTLDHPLPSGEGWGEGTVRRKHFHDQRRRLRHNGYIKGQAHE